MLVEMAGCLQQDYYYYSYYPYVTVYITPRG